MEDILEKDEAKDIKPEEYVTKYNIYVLDYASSGAIAFSVLVPNSVEDIDRFVQEKLRKLGYNLNSTSYMIVDDEYDTNDFNFSQNPTPLEVDKFRSIKCLFNMHRYEVYRVLNKYNAKREIVGNVIVSRCKHCGKIKVINIKIICDMSEDIIFRLTQKLSLKKYYIIAFDSKNSLDKILITIKIKVDQNQDEDTLIETIKELKDVQEVFII